MTKYDWIFGALLVAMIVLQLIYILVLWFNPQSYLSYIVYTNV